MLSNQVRAAMRRAWAVYKKRWPAVYGVLVLGLVLTSVASSTRAFLPDGWLGASAYQVLAGGLLAPVSAAVSLSLLGIVRGGSPTIRESFAIALRAALPLILAGFAVSIITGVGFLILIVPGLIAAIGLAFMPLLIAERGEKPMEAIPASWRLMRHHLGGAALVFYFWLPLGLFMGVESVARMVLGGLMLSTVGALGGFVMISAWLSVLTLIVLTGVAVFLGIPFAGLFLAGLYDEIIGDAPAVSTV